MSGSSSDSPKSASSSGDEDDKAGPSVAHQSSDESTTSDGVLVEIPGQDQSDGDRTEDAGREETFVDAPDELGGRGVDLAESMAMVDLGESSEDRSSPEHLARVRSECRKYKEEREVFGRQVAVLRRQLKEMMDWRVAEQLGLMESGGGGEEDQDLNSPTPLHKMMDDCSKFVDHLKGIASNKLQAEAMIRELNTVLYVKDQKIEDLNSSVSESAVSQDVIVSYLRSVQSLRLEAFLYEVQQIGQCLVECRPDFFASHCNDPSFVFSMVREQLLDGKRKESNFLEIVNRLEDENKKMAEQIDRMKDGLEEANAETSKIKTDLEQAENRLAAAKEKLGIAVSKGKSLVQHRDVLKQSLTEKTSELEKCMLELQQKSISLESMEANAKGLEQSLAEKTSELEQCFLALQQKSNDLKTLEASTEELTQSLTEKSDKLEMCLQELQQKSDALVAAQALSEEMSNTRSLVHSLQGSLSHKENVLHEIEEVMSQIETPQDLLSLDVIDRVRWFVDQKQVSEALLLERYKMKDAFSSIDLPEGIRSAELESQIRWLIESFSQSRDGIVKVQAELATVHAAAVTRESELSELQKEINLLAGSLSEEKKENDSLQDLVEDFRNKYEDMVEKFSLVSSQKDQLSKLFLELSGSTLEGQPSGDIDIMIENYIREVSKKVAISNSRTEDLERMQSLLYVSYQELMLRENMLEEEINNNSAMMKISNNLERASVEISALRHEKSSLQKELERVEEKASLLREKLSMAVKKGKGLMQEREGFKVSLDEKNAEIGKLKNDLQVRDSTIAEYEEKIKNLSGYPGQVQKLESDILLLKDQKDQIETFLHESNDRLQRLIESVEHVVLPTDTSFDGPLEKVSLIAEYIREFEAAKTHAEKELEKAKEEATLDASSLSDAFVAIKSLEDKLSEAEKLNSVIVEEKNVIQIGTTSMEYELEKMKEEISMQASKLEHAFTTITSLEEALLKANEKVAALDTEKIGLESKANNEMIILNAKLADCMKELAGAHGSLENQSADLANHLEHLQTLIKNDALLSLITNDFQEKIEGLRNMGSLLQDMHNQIEAKGFATHSHLMEHSRVLHSLPTFESFRKGQVVNSDTSTEDFNSSPSITKIVEAFHAQAKLVGDSFKGLSRFMDEHIMVISQALQAAIDENFQILELNGSLKLEVATLEDQKKVNEAKVISLQKDLVLLLSACNDATRELQPQLQGLLDSKPSSEHHLSSLDLISKEVTGSKGEEQTDVDYSRAAESLLFAARRVKVEFHQLENANRVMMTSIAELENKFKQAELTAENAIQDRDLIKERLSELEVDLAVLRNACSELRVQIKDHESKEDMWKEKEAELLSLQSSLIAKERGISEKSLSEDQVEILIGKVNKMENLLEEFQTTDQEFHFSSPVEKLDHLFDKVSVMKHTLESLTYEKDDMQLIIASHVREIEHLKNEIETISDSHQALESKNIELAEVTLALERIIRRLGKNETMEDKEMVSVKGLLFELERLVTTLSMEHESSRSRMQELGAKLQVKEKVVDDLSAKVKSLEESFHAQVLHPEVVSERTLFEAPPTLSAEISELEDAGPLVKSSISPMPAAAHVRTMRKGSADHLALNIDSESERLITPRETDEKGHVFKSLNTSGLIPKQGKLIADRVDGIWVSGGRILMSRPGARLGLIAYWLLLHIWVLGTIL